jgi:hypothetical protein
MRWCVGITVAAVLFGFGVTFGQERSDKPGGEKPAKPEFKPPFFGRGPGFGGFTPPANREEAIQRVRQQLERAREMVKQLEGMLSRLEAEQRAGDARREEPRREARPGDKPPAARETRPDSDRRDGKPEARRPEKPPFRKPEPRRDDHARRPAPPPQFPGRFGWWGRGRFGPGWGRWTPPGWGRWGMPGWGRWLGAVGNAATAPLGSDDSVLPPGNAGGLLVSQAGGVRNDFAAIPTSRPDSIELPVSWKKSAANSARDADSCMPGRPNWLAQTGLLFRTKKRISAQRIGMAMRLANRVQSDALLQTPVGETCRYARGEADCHFSDQGSGSAGM